MTEFSSYFMINIYFAADGGESFTAAELNKKNSAVKPKRNVCSGEGCPPPLQIDAPPPQQGVGRNWAWKQFEEVIPLSTDQRAQLQRGESVDLEIVAKAIDGDFNSQPEKMSHIYNVLGICVNHWHRVKVTVDPRFSSDDAATMPTAEPVPPPGCAYVLAPFICVCVCGVPLPLWFCTYPLHLSIPHTYTPRKHTCHCCRLQRATRCEDLIQRYRPRGGREGTTPHACLLIVREMIR